MIDVILAIKDYIKDVWHDYIQIPRWRRQEHKADGWVIGRYVPWKEGPLSQYIFNRRMVKKTSK